MTNPDNVREEAEAPKIAPHSSIIYTDLTVRCNQCKQPCIWRYLEEKDEIEVLFHVCLVPAAPAPEPVGLSYSKETMQLLEEIGTVPEPVGSGSAPDHKYSSNGASRDPCCSICNRESYEHRRTAKEDRRKHDYKCCYSRIDVTWHMHVNCIDERTGRDRRSASATREGEAK